MRGFKVKSKKKKKKNGPAHEGPPIKPVKPAGKPVKPDGKPVKPAGKPVARKLLNFKPVKPAGKPVGTDCTGKFEFGFEFNRFPPVTGLTDPVNRYRRAAVTGFRLGNKTLGGYSGRGERRCHLWSSDGDERGQERRRERTGGSVWGGARGVGRG